MRSGREHSRAAPRSRRAVDPGSTVRAALEPGDPRPFDPQADYPLGDRRPDLVSTPAGTPLADVTLQGLRDGSVDGRELRATPETLSRQAAVAHAAGRRALAENLVRASELARVPDDEMLEIYTALRPHRSTEDDLLRWAARLEQAYDARATAAFVREAIPVYSKRGPAAGGGSWIPARDGLGASRIARSASCAARR